MLEMQETRRTASPRSLEAGTVAATVVQGEAMTADLVLALDQGTTSSRAALVDL